MDRNGIIVDCETNKTDQKAVLATASHRRSNLLAPTSSAKIVKGVVDAKEAVPAETKQHIQQSEPMLKPAKLNFMQKPRHKALYFKSVRIEPI